MNIALKALIGSHNYNLNTESSDKDYKVFYIPTFDNLYKGKIESKSVKENGNDVEYHDIRRLPEFLKKANINFVEVLFSKEIEASPYLLKMIYDMRNDLAKMNLPYLYKSSIGTAMSRFKDYQKAKEQGDLTKANKQLANAIRMLDFICRYAVHECQDFKSAIWYSDDDSNGKLLLDIRNGVIDGTGYYHASLRNAESWKDFYMDQEFDDYIYDAFEKVIKKLVVHHLKEEIK